jgi:regulator of sirC expression with transglutaminase-like and TPR domain
MTAVREDFAAQVAAGERCDLARAALAIARLGHPDLDPAPSLERLDALAAGVRGRLHDGLAPDEAAVKVARYLFDECGFHGNADDYHDPRNSFLNDVLERRTGIPISLSVLLMEIGARLALCIEGVGFPGHFLVRVEARGGPVVLDPFFGGRVLGRDELLERLRAFYAAGGGPPGSNLQRVLPQALQVSGRLAILERMLANLLRIYLDREEHAQALRTVELLVVLTPDAAETIRVRGLLHERLECFGSALADLRRYLELAPHGSYAAEIREHVRRLARTLH